MAELEEARDHFIQGMSRISSFWGLPKTMGAVYGAIYLCPQPVSLDDLVEQVRISKGAASTHVRHLERLGLVRKHYEIGSRKDYYIAETDFWKVTRGLLRKREQSEFDAALKTVDESLAMVEADGESAEIAAFYKKRMGAMQAFFQTLDNLVASILKLESLISLNALQNLIRKSRSAGEASDENQTL